MPIEETTGTPTRQAEKARLQRERILKAAETCFVKHGFHAAAMAQIAETAAMSPGLIYRYFENKHAIVLAIIEQQLEEVSADIRDLYHAPDLAQAIFEDYLGWRDASPAVMSAPLFFEITAESTRDPRIAEALRISDQRLRDQVIEWLAAPVTAGGKGLPAPLAESHALALACFIEGLITRALRSPDLPPEQVKATIDDFLARLFERP